MPLRACVRACVCVVVFACVRACVCVVVFACVRVRQQASASARVHPPPVHVAQRAVRVRPHARHDRRGRVGGGAGGGQVVGIGTPETLAGNPDSFTGRYLKHLL